jgi:Cysteine rich repeat
MKTSLLFLSALALSATVAFAADAPQGAGPRTACKADVATLCPGLQPGGGRIASCLKQNQEKVSPGCKDAMSKMRDRKATPKPDSAQ